MKTPVLTVPKNFIETEAEDHAEETRRAVKRGKSSGPDEGKRPGHHRSPADKDRPETPWQID
jgi:hypothetical protein